VVHEPAARAVILITVRVNQPGATTNTYEMFHFEFLETGFTVGEVAGLISGSIATCELNATGNGKSLIRSCIVHIVVPLTSAVVAVGLVKNRQHDAAAWSAIAHQLQSTMWPILLQADSALGNWMIWKGKRIPWRIFLLGFLTLLTTLALVAAGFLTPRPLTETNKPSHRMTQASFIYVPGMLPSE
jgi:hypothetical protein